MARQTADQDAGVVALNQGTDIIHKILRHIRAILGDPCTRHKLFAVGDLVDVVNARRGLIRIIGNAVNNDHAPAVALVCSLDCGAADHERLVNIHAGGDMGGAALKRAEFHRAGLAAHLAADQVGQEGRRAGELLVTKGIHVIRAAAGLADIGAIRQTDALGNGDEHGILVRKQVANLAEEGFDIKGNLGEIDEINALAILALGQRGSAGQPAGIAAHDLDDGDEPAASYKRSHCRRG